MVNLLGSAMEAQVAVAAVLEPLAKVMLVVLSLPQVAVVLVLLVLQGHVGDQVSGA
jgi:hypothetical protein